MRNSGSRTLLIELTDTGTEQHAVVDYWLEDGWVAYKRQDDRTIAAIPSHRVKLVRELAHPEGRGPEGTESGVPTE